MRGHATSDRTSSHSKFNWERLYIYIVFISNWPQGKGKRKFRTSDLIELTSSNSWLIGNDYNFFFFFLNNWPQQKREKMIRTSDLIELTSSHSQLVMTIIFFI